MRFSLTHLLVLDVATTFVASMPIPPPNTLTTISNRDLGYSLLKNGVAPGTDAPRAALKTGIAYLNSHKANSPDGQCHINVGPGPSTCQRVSCSAKTAITVCNDNTTPISPLCTDVASWSQIIYDQAAYPGNFGEVRVHGQLFVEGQNWNVIVNGAKC